MKWIDKLVEEKKTKENTQSSVKTSYVSTMGVSP